MSYIYEKYDESLFIQRFQNVGRVDNFGYDGLRTLFLYLENLAEDIGEPIECDPIAFCCDYSRYENLAEFQNDFGEKYKTLDDIQDQTTLILIDDENGPFIIQSF